LDKVRIDRSRRAMLLLNGGVYWDRTSRAVGAGFTVQCITIDASTPCLKYNTLHRLCQPVLPVMWSRRVYLATLSRYAVNRCAGGGGECVVKHTGRGVPSADSTELISNMLYYAWIFCSTRRTPSPGPPV